MSLQTFNAELLRMDQLNEVQNNYSKTLRLLAALKSGEVSLDNVALTPGGWTLVLPEPRPEPVVIEVPPGTHPLPSGFTLDSGSVEITAASTDV